MGHQGPETAEDGVTRILGEGSRGEDDMGKVVKI
jgi:hypothetical protein